MTGPEESWSVRFCDVGGVPAPLLDPISPVADTGP